MLETDSSRQVFNPELNQKTDSVFYALGILQGLQQAADHYVLQGEMRGDLVQTTDFTDNNLRQLADFSATTANRYDSAYVYYRVINNCNYYIAHVDTTLRTGSDYVMMNEYVAVKSLRAWTYMQLARVYGQVPFYTEPLTQISQIDKNDYPVLDMKGIVSALAPDLEQYAKDKLYTVPHWSGTPQGANFAPDYIFIPVDVVLGDMYLETGNYDRAASHYVNYLTREATSTHTAYMASFSTGRNVISFDELPSDFDMSNLSMNQAAGTWSSIFTTVGNDYITYIPMASSSQYGATTALPLAFGYDFYATDKTGESRYVDEIQIQASDDYLRLSSSLPFYYYSTLSTASTLVINQAQLGDMRYASIIRQRADVETDSVQVWITKLNNARIPLYRTTTVLLHLAEALNRLGMPDAAFAILKDGISESLVKEEGGAAYITPETRKALTTTYPLLSDANKSKFAGTYANFGVHMHGAGFTRDFASVYTPDLSPYQMDTIVGQKLAEISAGGLATVGTTRQDTINAVEDLLCDEYALEFAFEGTRFYDLCRLARHKNQAGLYGVNFGGQWLARKLAFKNPVKDLTNEQNWYLPLK